MKCFLIYLERNGFQQRACTVRELPSRDANDNELICNTKNKEELRRNHTFDTLSVFQVYFPASFGIDKQLCFKCSRLTFKCDYQEVGTHGRQVFNGKK